jgi:signal transduction histidine kinase
MPTVNRVETLFKEACQLTEACWVARIALMGEAWQVETSYKLSRLRMEALQKFLSAKGNASWLGGALTGGRVRTKTMPETGLGCQHLYLFPCEQPKNLLITACSQEFSAQELGIWRIIAQFGAGQAGQADDLPAAQVNLVAPYDVRRTCEAILRDFRAKVPCLGAFIAVRKGDELEVRAVSGSGSSLRGKLYSIETHPIFDHLNRAPQALRLLSSDHDWAYAPRSSAVENRAWVGAPILLGRRLIGFFCAWRGESFTAREARQLEHFAGQIASSIEVAITFSEISEHLRRLALANEFALTVSLAFDLSQVMERTFALLERAFRSQSLALFLLSSNGQAVREIRPGGGSHEYLFADLPPALSSFLSGSESLRWGSRQQARFPGLFPENQSALGIHLRYRGQVLGALVVESAVQEAFSIYDEQVLAVIASHLASLLEYNSRTMELEKLVSQLEETQQELRARIGAQREAEARLVQAAKLAAVGEMAAGVAHELNNPLTSVVGFTELAIESLPPDSATRTDLEIVMREARRARSVVRRLLDFARQGETVRVRADINEIVDDVIVLTKHLLHINGVALELRLGENVPWVLMDRNQIKQVIINLVNNALYAMPSGGSLCLQTSLEHHRQRPGICLVVKDTGVGIPPENLERIFEPFFTTRGSQGGTGLGLSVTYGIVTDHGGRIEVESRIGLGTTFVVWLPLEEAAS